MPVFSRSLLTARWFLLLTVAGYAARSAAGTQASSMTVPAIEEYRILVTEIKLAEADTLYLVVNLDSRQLTLKLRGAVLWSCSFESAAVDSSSVNAFGRAFLGAEMQFLRRIEESYLVSAREQTPDSVLAIVSEATGFAPELMQRQIPSRFALVWNGVAELEVRTDGIPEAGLKLKDALYGVRHIIRSRVHNSCLRVRLRPEDALTLYRVARPGLRSLVITSM